MEISKRDLLAAGAGIGTRLAVPGAAFAQGAATKGLDLAVNGTRGVGTPPPKGLEQVKIIVFDTFGSVVDWRGSIIKDLTAWGEKEGLHADWTQLAVQWRGMYNDEKDWVRTGKLPWTNLEALNAISLDQLLPKFPGLAKITAEQKHHINMVWRRLHGWPDAVRGLTRLKARYAIGPLSNGSVGMLTAMAKFAGLPWDVIFSCELFKHYKPDPETYLGVVQLMALKPDEVMLGAAHASDLSAAQRCGLKTAYFPRPLEDGPPQPGHVRTEPVGPNGSSNADLNAGRKFDLVATDIEDFARQMGL